MRWRERWGAQAEAELDATGHYDRAQKLIPDDDAERAAIESEEPVARPRNYREIYELEDLAETALVRDERFPSEHWTARTLLEKDIPKWRKTAREIASGLEAKS